MSNCPVIRGIAPLFLLPKRSSQSDPGLKNPSRIRHVTARSTIRGLHPVLAYRFVYESYQTKPIKYRLGLPGSTIASTLLLSEPLTSFTSWMPSVRSSNVHGVCSPVEMPSI